MKSNKENVEKKTSLRNIIIKKKKINKYETKEDCKIKDNTYTENEMNSLSYEEALKFDKRTYCQYYFSLLKRKQLIIFTFYTANDYNSRSIKICLFLFSFALDYIVNALFYNDDKMHNIYEDEGKYNIFSQITNIIYSTLFSTVINSLLEYLSLSEDSIIKVRKDGDEKNKIKKCMKIKFIVFYILIFSKFGKLS